MSLQDAKLTRERFERIDTILLEALERPPAERAAYLDSSCADDPDVRTEVESLLKAQRRADFLDHAAAEVCAPPPTSDPSMWVGRRIAQYSVVRLLGSGGMADVYEARQDSPKRTVALKVLKDGVTSRSAVKRFEYESRVLANLRHPCIAQVYEAGTHDEGDGVTPYFAMEYIPNARSITEYAHAKKLGMRERLELFALVCDAVHHGHQKGIIHRDLKPSNMLVDAHGQAKIIDFGVARATGSDMAVTTLQTAVGQLVGTLQYMSPEQCDADPHDIDTRSDVYSLGVVLYELLTGRLPYDLKGKPIPESLRVIREQEPAAPSTIHRTLRGDVETIALKALEKERSRRYQSAENLARDIEHYLKGEPIDAKRDSGWYVLRKTLRRYRVPAALGAAFLVLIVSASVALSVMYGRAERDRRVAQAVNDFLTKDLLAAVAPSSESGKGKDVLMRDVLDEAAERIEEAASVGGRFEAMPLVEASIRATLGLTYHQLGEYAAAEPHLERTRLLRRGELGEEHPHTLDAMNNLANLYDDQGRYDEAEPMYVKTLETRKRVLGEEHPRTLSSMNNLANLYYVQARYDEAEPMYVKTLDIYKRVLGEEHPDTLSFMINLATFYDSLGRYDVAEPMYIKTLEIMKRVLGEEHRSTLKSMNNLANMYDDQGRYDEAEPLSVKTLEIMKRVLGEEHPDTLSSMNNLATMYADQGRYEQAEALYVKTLEIQKRVLGEEHPDTLRSMYNIAFLYQKQGRYDEAEPLYVKTLRIRKRVLGEEHPSTLDTMNNLAFLYQTQGRMDDVRPLVRALQEGRRLRADRPGASARDKNSLAWDLLTCEPADLRDPETALSLARDACAMTDNVNPAFLDTLALAQHLTGDTPAAIETEKKALSLLAPDAPRGDYEAALAKFEAALKQADTAEEPGGG